METFALILLILYTVWGVFAIKHLLKLGFQKAFETPVPFGIWFLSLCILIIGYLIYLCIEINPVGKLISF